MIRTVLTGAGGRMGKILQAEAAEAEGVEIVFGVDPALSTFFDDSLPEADVVIDFSTPAALRDELSFCVARNLPLVLAATGHDQDALALLEEAAQRVAILRSANLSQGVFALAALARAAGPLLSGRYDVAIVETHHRWKKDAPSGTAKLLAHALGGNAAQTHSLRGGGGAGVHEVCWLGDFDTLTLRHEALDRRLFARGALNAARWIVDCAPGLYGMEDLFADGLGATFSAGGTSPR